jgi:uncharacterized OB-fold protein
MINIYVKANSAQMQNDQHAKNGQAPVKIIEKPVKVLRACPSCGKQDVMSSDFCPFCGSSMSERTPTVIAEQAATIEKLTIMLQQHEKILREISAHRAQWKVGGPEFEKFEKSLEE